MEAPADGGGGEEAAEREPWGPNAAVGAAAAGGGVEGDAGTERQLIRWDRFLPRRSIRVLLVEHDDSTRHIVAALLRKCSYHVAAVADGLKAWEVLKEKHCNFDLVLTEIAMPSLSGIGLLSNIMAGEEFKNIPVIMMSTQDSIGVVLKCMLKGAADFLVKPVRKNELRNLWQHVWRRHCSSSYANASENCAASNQSCANGRVGSNSGDNSEQGDAQSSGSKQEMDIESGEGQTDKPQAEPGASFMEFKAKAEQLKNGIEQPANDSNINDRGQSRGVGVETTQADPGTLLANLHDGNKFSNTTSTSRDYDQRFAVSKKAEDGVPSSYHASKSPNPLSQNMIGSDLADKTLPANFQRNGIRQDVLCEASRSSNWKSKSEHGPSMLLELSLNRSLSNGCSNAEFTRKHTWNHSDSSAFSRYGIKHTCDKPVSSALCKSATESADKSRFQDSNYGPSNEKGDYLSHKELQFHKQKAVESVQSLNYFQPPTSSNKEEIHILSSGPARYDSCADASSNVADSVYHRPQFGFVPLPISVGAIPYQSMFSGYGAALQPMFYPDTLHPHNVAILEQGTIQMPSDQNCQPQNHPTNHPGFIEYHHHEENHQSNCWRQQTNTEPAHPEEPSCTPMEHGNQSGSCSHEIHITSRSHGCETDAAANVGNTLESGNESGVQKCSQKGLDRDCSRREAALIKFRLKRKDRCFEKKVRYHSRKKLAEQRPRVKGQFVRQKALEPPTGTSAEY